MGARACVNAIVRTVFALPMGSMIGLVAISRVATLPAALLFSFWPIDETAPRCETQSFIASVLPAPLSPEMSTESERAPAVRIFA